MTTVKLPVKWNVRILATDDLRKALLSIERLEPWTLTVGAKHAIPLEFGSGPAQNREGEPPDFTNCKTELQRYKAIYNASEFYRSLVDWVRRKAGPQLKPTEQYRMAYTVYVHLCSHGMTARPFFRPAFYYTCEHSQEWFNQGYSIQDMVQLMEQKMNDLIKDNPLAPEKSRYMPFSGTLQESISIRAMTEEEIESAKKPAENPRPISDDVWEDRSRTVGRQL